MESSQNRPTTHFHPPFICLHHHLPIYPHHHHHHYYHQYFIARHGLHCPRLTFPLSPHFHKPLDNYVALGNSSLDLIQDTHHASSQLLQTQEHAENGEQEEDEEPIFVLTDEWKEFFAESEAKRKLAKKQAKKKGKNRGGVMDEK